MVAFTGPAWWYGPVIAAQKGNPTGIKSFDDLKGKKVGAIAGSAADEYLGRIGVEITPSSPTPRNCRLSTGKVDAILDDDVKFLDYMKANAAAPIEIVPGVAMPED